MTLTTYRARDRRVYNGALCSDMRREHDRTRYLENLLREADPTARCTYFPMEGKFMVFTNSNILENPHLVGPPRELTDVMHTDKQVALIEAIEHLNQKGESTHD